MKPGDRQIALAALAQHWPDMAALGPCVVSLPKRFIKHKFGRDYEVTGWQWEVKSAVRETASHLIMLSLASAFRSQDEVKFVECFAMPIEVLDTRINVRREWVHPGDRRRSFLDPYSMEIPAPLRAWASEQEWAQKSPAWIVPLRPGYS